MPLAGLAWQTLSDPGALALVDAESRRAAALARPHPADLPMVQIVDIERLVCGWLAPASRPQAEQALLDQLRADPVRTMRGLCWLMAMWVVALHLRTGRPPTTIVAELSLRGFWRGPQAPESERVWEELVGRVRIGVLAALTSDDSTADEFRRGLVRPAGIAPVIMGYALRLLDDLSRQMIGYGVDPQEMAGTLALYTVDPQDQTAACFRPLT